MSDRQGALADEGFERYRKPTRREQFLEEMEQIIPWAELTAVIEPFYPAGKGAGRPPIGIEQMLRIHFVQHWFNLSDPAVEEALYDSRALRRFVGIDLGREPVPDETTICKFRHLLERHDLGARLFVLIGEYLDENGLKVNRSTHRGCDHHQCTELDEEPEERTRSGDAPDEERQRVVLRDEGACRRGQQDEADPLDCGDTSQRARLEGAA